MGFRFHVDGNCRKCGKTSEFYCDHCGLYFCEDHLVKVHVTDSPKFFILCEKCHKQKKKPVDPYQIHTNPSFK